MPRPSMELTMIEPAPRRSVELPDEILCKIIFYTLGHNSSVIHGRHYSTMAKLFEQLANLFCVSSKFQGLTKSVFYGKTMFKFPIDIELTRSFVNKHGNSLGPLLPMRRALSSLRRITLEIVIMDSRLELLDPARRGFLNRDSHELRKVIWFSSVGDLYRYCPGARTLRLLTNNTTELTVLDIHIFEDFRHDDKQWAIDLYRTARFNIRAGEVNVRVSSLLTPDSPQKPWYPDLIKALNIEKRVTTTDGRRLTLMDGDCH